MKSVKIKQMKSIIFTFCLLLTCVSAYTQDETRDLGSYSSISVSGSIAVDMHYGDPKAEITMLKGDIDKLKTEIRSGNLRIYYDKKTWNSSSEKYKAKIDLYFNNVDDISVSAGSSLECDELIKANNFDADASSGAHMEINVEAGSVDSNVSSGALIYINGETKELDIDVSSGGSFKGAGLKAKEVDADASSGGSAKVWATESIHADASSGGSVRYKGEPDKKDLNPGKWSGGQVSKL